ncbi:MAG: protein TolQ [Gammaproteobacteria bacterium]|nr:protein TolQ [Gammaproteobacteria bacterium]
MIAASGEGIAMFELLKNASLLVQLVMLLLLIASVISWTMIFRKWITIKAASQHAYQFEQRFWSGGNLDQMYTDLTRADVEPTGMESVFVDGFQEFRRLEQKSNITPSEMLDGVHRVMRVALVRETDYLETTLPFLATVGSTSPYVGLFGTVWGIMNSFRSLGAVQQATIAHVAPGIAEALIATAMGLFAAIPAVIAYNRYSTQVERLLTRYEIFMEEFLSVIQRRATISTVK